jgi:endonuclease III
MKKMDKQDELQDRIKRIYKILTKEVKDYKVPIVDLIQVQTKDPFKVLVTTILSARTKDETTAEVARRLFIKIKKPHDFDKYTKTQIEKLIFPIGFYKNKARFLKDLPSALDKNGGKVPDNLEGLLTLPGVGRKTANLVLEIAFKQPNIAVDIHVFI